jgi:PTH1 family peptidyl-tRNA hydrolase
MSLQWFSRLFGRKGSPVPADAVVVGIGNIGAEYEGTRHNIGFEVVRGCIARVEVLRQEQSCHAAVALGRYRTEGGTDLSVVLARPQTYVNRSGQSVKALVSSHGVELGKCLVVVDDYNLPLGKLRFRRSGSDGGHNGLKSIIAAVGEDFPRLRIGIGPLPAGEEVVDFVLGRFSAPEQPQVDAAVSRAVEAVFFCLANGVEKAMNTYNRN